MTKTILEDLKRTTDQTFSEAELVKKLESARPLRIKYGVDITAPFLHLGHAVNLWMMRRLQDAGHKVLFLLGDFTTRIGDPTGRSGARRVPSEAEIAENASAFLEQCGTILRQDEEVFEVRRNSEWFGAMNTAEFMSLLGMVTHGRLIQRDMFQVRLKEQKEIWMHEMLYPVLQGYDSYMLESDLTIVGTDQLFNEMMGRMYQERFGQRPQVVMTSRITPGTDGKQKQSKSIGNYIAISDTPRDKFGKVMSIPDELIVQYLEVYTTVPLAEVREIAGALKAGHNPMPAKKRLAEAVVDRYHGAGTAAAERAWFDETFSRRRAPEERPVVSHPSGGAALDFVVEAMKICTGTAPSKSEAKRLITQGGFKLDGAAIRDPFQPIARSGDVKLGKRNFVFLEVTDTESA